MKIVIIIPLLYAATISAIGFIIPDRPVASDSPYAIMKAQIKGGECYWAKCGDTCDGGFIPKQFRLCDPRSGPTQRYCCH
ncbi:hypothetical protein FPQ18DRAFT_345013 [Pyronema domesticum]|uniref:Uncharacterized protein n=1 Tax=Pyronema omphalodes (strain CBS 100304) TaxID=1076935 RepID=U4LWA1_PYROM|nr:hypothetical protein FPQ18DRAFT_345013 [Pyronema domesticum]CCX33436.1 Protein of unknown function [Pyronema omphalodes CBS 100304]